MKVSEAFLSAAVSGIILGAQGLAGAGTSGSASSWVGEPLADPLDAADAGAKHACKGQNACKGQGGCKTDKHACAGQNACKGQGGCRTDGKKM